MSESARSGSSNESSPSPPTTENEDSSPPSRSSKPGSPPSKSSTDTPSPADDSSSSSQSDSKSSPPSPPSNSNSSPPSPPSNSNSSPPSNSDSSPPSQPSGSSPPLESSDSPPNNSDQSNSPPTKSSPPPGKQTSPSQSSDSPRNQKAPPPPSKTPSSKQSPSSSDSPPETPSDVPTPPTKNKDRTPRLSPPSTKSDSGSSKQASSKSSSESSKDSGQGVVVGVTLLGVAIIILFAILFIILRKKKKRREEAYIDHHRPPNSFSRKSDGYYYHGQPAAGNSGLLDSYHGMKSHGPYSGGHGSNYGSNRGPGFNSGMTDPNAMGNSKSWFSYEELMDITNGFSRQNVLGEGGFGCVYKGQLKDGKEVAVKQLKAGSGQGEREFQAEVEIISRVHHRHLVTLVGYCIAEHHRLLVYEFVPNDTLEHHLHGKGNVFIEWPNRVKIAVGAAKGLAYLHEDCHPRIIHRDIKSANILLDNSFEAKVADFGLAKLSNDTHTHVSTRVMGTFGYLAPEYASSGKLTDRSDVFSFGVVLLEIVTGRRPVDASQPLGEESLVEWARPLLIHAIETGEFGELVDPRLENNFKTNEMFRMIEVAASCVRHSASKRPRMVQVVRALDSEGDMVDLTNGVKFGQSTIFEAGQYSVDIRKFQRMAFGSEDLSSDYGPSGEYDKKSSTYSAEYRSREMPQRPPNPWKGGEPTSGEYPNSSESETHAMFAQGSGRSSDEFHHANYGYNKR